MPSEQPSSPVGTWFRKWWFLLSLAVVLAIGMTAPSESNGSWHHTLSNAVPRGAVVAVVLFLMSAPLELSAMWHSIRKPGPAWTAVFINICFAPPLAALVGLFLTPEYSMGTIIAACVPCTLASAAVWTRRAEGNEAIALLVTVITNLACFLTAPAWLSLLIGEKVNVESFKFTAMASRLFFLVVLPILIAQSLRFYRPIATFFTKHKYLLGTIAQIGLLSIVWVGAVGCGQHINGAANGQATALATGKMLVAVVVLHLMLAAIAYGASKWFGFTRPDRAAVTIAGSQKTLMVGLDIALSLGGLVLLPMVAYHVAQLLIDTLIAERLKRE